MNRSNKIESTVNGLDSFSVEILTVVTPSWKTKSNKSISTIEDRIPRWLQHHHKVCCEKGELV